MKKITETHVHVAVRNWLKRSGWKLIAGQYPGGSDDECSALNIVDPALAKDKSPDPRRHSDNKLVPDIVALSGRNLLLIEMKPNYSKADQEKLEYLVGERSFDLVLALKKFALDKGCKDLEPIETLVFNIGLGFSKKSTYQRDRHITYFLFEDLETVEVHFSDHLIRGVE